MTHCGRATAPARWCAICQMLGPNSWSASSAGAAEPDQRQDGDDPVDGVRGALVEAAAASSGNPSGGRHWPARTTPAGWTVLRSTGRSSDGSARWRSALAAGFGAAAGRPAAALLPRPSRASSSAAWEICASRSSIEVDDVEIVFGRTRQVEIERLFQFLGDIAVDDSAWSLIFSPCRRYPVLDVRKRQSSCFYAVRAGGLNMDPPYRTDTDW